ncbi:hypothetical protein BSL78_13122 [Apostichopus japonicus]|uniref:Uncharacterized protein n=1 Tax=Stichopus japonicus TaxID=307972 RepID=A0A2G8KPX0_STIJA|nr:hypothetical protein BSL78_13122 [Apostichopus japonicus]
MALLKNNTFWRKESTMNRRSATDRGRYLNHPKNITVTLITKQVNLGSFVNMRLIWYLNTPGYRDQDNTDVHHQTTHRRSRSPKRKRPSTKGQGLRSNSRGRRHKDVPSTSQDSMEMQKCNSSSKATNLKDEECLSTRKPVICNSDGERFGFKFFLKQCSKIYTNPNRKDRYLLPGVTPGTDVTPYEQTYIMKCVAKEEASRKPLPYASSKRSVYKYWKEKYGITRRGLCLTNLSDVKSLEEIEAEYQERQQRNEEGIILSQEERKREGMVTSTTQTEEYVDLPATETVEIEKIVHLGEENDDVQPSTCDIQQKRAKEDHLARSNVGNITIWLAITTIWRKLLKQVWTLRLYVQSVAFLDCYRRKVVSHRNKDTSCRANSTARRTTVSFPGPITINIYCGANNTTKCDSTTQTTESQYEMKATTGSDVRTLSNTKPKPDVTEELVEKLDRLKRDLELMKANSRDNVDKMM